MEPLGLARFCVVLLKALMLLVSGSLSWSNGRSETTLLADLTSSLESHCYMDVSRRILLSVIDWF